MQNCAKLTIDNFYFRVLHSHRCLTCQNETMLDVADNEVRLSFDSKATLGKLCSTDTNSKCILLEDLFSSSLKVEEISDYACDKCTKAQQVAEKRMTFCNMPDFLKITLNRFYYDKEGPHKVTTAIDIPRTLIVPVNGQNSMQHIVFCLVGTIIHVGTGPNNGHYYSIARNQTVIDMPPSATNTASLTRDSDFFTDEWVCFDDQNVSLTSFDFFARSNKSSYGTPYVIVYKKIKDEVADSNFSLSADVVGDSEVLRMILKDNEEHKKVSCSFEFTFLNFT